MFARTAVVVVALLVGTVGTSADAQRRQRVVEVFGDDKCPEGAKDEIVVCSKKPESDRYRIPTEFREATVADSQTQESRVDEMVAAGRTGTGSCSPVGPGGFTGCFEQQAQQGRVEKKANRRARSQEPR